MSEPTPGPTPDRAVYGFAWFVFFKILFILYVGWALIPNFILKDVLGLNVSSYLPDKYFALFLPVLVLCALTVFAVLTYPTWNMRMQDDINNFHTLRDKHTIVRCQYEDSTRTRCKKAVDPIPAGVTNNFNSWLFEKFCNVHKNQRNQNENEYNQQDSDNNQAGCCDCVDQQKCWLQKHPNHLNVLKKRTKVPNVCDLDVSDVCKELFLDK